MSRSYKKTPVVKDYHSGKKGKRQANRKVRRCKHIISSGNSYRKVYETWDIHDSVSRYSYQQFLVDKESEGVRVEQGVEKSYPTYTYSDWAKSYYRK